MKLEKDLVILDFETTGIDVVADRIVQIGALKLRTDGTEEFKEVLVDPTIPIPLEASEVHGITDKMVEDKAPFRSIAKSFREFLVGCDLGGFNSNSYDLPLLNEEFVRAGLKPIDWNPSLIDVMLLYRKLYSGKLSDIYERFTGEPLEGAHSALEDVKASKVVLDYLINEAGLKDLKTSELDTYIQGDKERADLAGKFYKKEGEIFWNFGKHLNKTLKETAKDNGYINWFLSGSFPTESKNFLIEWNNTK